jgi:predicted phage-related endonuclease
MIERRTILERSEWLAWRRHDITASATGALFGTHPYRTALRLHLEKRGVTFPDAADDPVKRRGRWLEPAVARAAAEERPDWTIVPAGVYLRDPELRLGATPDFFIRGDPRGLGVLQAKSVAPAPFEREWDGGRTLPRWIAIQARIEAMLADARFAIVGVLIVDPYAMELHLLDVPRDPAAEREIADAVRRFWADVEAGRAPSPDYARDADAIDALAGSESPGKVFDAHNELPVILAERAKLKTRDPR